MTDVAAWISELPESLRHRATWSHPRIRKIIEIEKRAREPSPHEAPSKCADDAEPVANPTKRRRRAAFPTRRTEPMALPSATSTSALRVGTKVAERTRMFGASTSASSAAKAAAQKQRSLDHQEMGDGCIHGGSGGERRK